jgi:hypothetical protein
MKVSILALLAGAVLATARVVPSCDRGTTDVDSFSEYDVTIITTTQICDKRCASWPPICGRGWYPKKFGKCWACCKGPRHPHGFELEEEEFEGVDELD